MCLHVAVEIRELGGNIKKVTVQGFYERNIKKKDVYISTLDDIGLWLDSKLNTSRGGQAYFMLYSSLETSATPF
uniref:Uncharacterized protein n=1 Tax=Rhizophagus irregularis (strain DAOM 181602 / DAOM 197198 / MUCL 43194) TaxID=747089 RepID=U9UB82_RHIID